MCVAIVYSLHTAASGKPVPGSRILMKNADGRLLSICAAVEEENREEKKHVSNFNETVIRSRCTFRTPDKKMES